MAELNRYISRPSHTPTRTLSKDSNELNHSINIPKPNILRIEVLSADARQAFLGGFHKILDKVKYVIMKQLADGEGYKPFYGFISSSTLPNLSVTANYQKPDKTGFDQFTSMIPFVGKPINDATKGIRENVNSIITAAGLDSTSTGSSTIQTFTGATIAEGFIIDCIWYMPEQEDLFRVSIKRLLQLAYVRNVTLTQGNIKATLTSAVSTALTQIVSVSAATIKDLKTDFAISTNESATTDDATATTPVINFPDAVESMGSALATATSAVATVAVDIDTFFGGNFTLAPLPVRVSVGHIYDLEPMVISNVTLQPSTETFQNSIGAHIPIFMSAKMQFKYWMNPGPNNKCISIIGDEMFGSKENK